VVHMGDGLIRIVVRVVRMSDGLVRIVVRRGDGLVRIVVRRGDGLVRIVVRSSFKIVWARIGMMVGLRKGMGEIFKRVIITVSGTGDDRT
jgi:hypothetical protein